MFKSVRYYDGSFDQEKFDNQMLATVNQDGLMSKEDKTKLDELTGGTTNSIEAGNVVQDETHRFVTDEQITAWDTKPENKEALDLGNVTNDAQVKRVEMGVANGVATLDDTGLIPSSQLPGFVDDVLEFTTIEEFPEVGESGKLYIDTTKNVTYRWSGTQYVDIPSGGIALGETSATAYAGDKGKANTDAINAIVIGETVVPKAVDASTISGFVVGANVPANAKFTDTVYQHPETHEAAMIVESEEKKFVSNEQITNWNAKAEYVPNIPYYDEEQHAVYACGVGITVDKSNTDGKITIKWAEVGGYKTIEVPEGPNIYGGGHGLDRSLFYPCTCITVNGGIVGSIYGGNNERGAVGNATIIINNAKFNSDAGVQGGGKGWHNPSARETDNIVGHAEVVINNTDGKLLTLYGGAQSIAVVGSTKVTVNGGTIGWITAGGSNGYTGIAEVTINDGNITVIQGCNRGSMSNIKTTINGGTIQKVYAGGETEDTNVTATFDRSELNINGGTITSVTSGTNGGVESSLNVFGTYKEGTISDSVASSINLTKASMEFTDITLEDNTLVFKHNDKVVKSIDLSTINA